ncbi:hypothetical protein [Chondromyces crocatus]|uniref:Uncharacterized protein n=1 Tax=Chondromyces crocatus TaxID=52 RepID=A0A0K1ETA3_CHOCO|nr:hypothetical protein [Chondromyces crocatus]AKT43882.1 uncharacterized protein CMC5_081190 [Chondromyces crocatus]
MSLQLPLFRITAIAAITSGLTGCIFLMPPPSSGPIEQDPSATEPHGSDPGSAPSHAASPSFGDTTAGAAKPSAPPPEPPKRIPTTVQIRSECSKTVPVFYGEKPKYGSGTRSTVSGNSISSWSRKADGTLVVWIIDDKENGLASARVTPDTQRVVVDRSCTSLRAE